MTSLVAVVIVGFLCTGLSTGRVVVKNVQCDSRNYAYALCRVWGERHVVEMSVIRRDSRSRCRFGSSYGFNGGYIWVNNGCRALFSVRTCSSTLSLDCDSRNYAYATCPVPGANVEHVVLKTRRSRSRCTRGYSYGAVGAAVWVNRGCRAKFTVCYE